MNKVPLKNSCSNLMKKQRGATLITSLMMLVVMTIAGVSAVKVSTVDILSASNDQQRMMVFQETANKLKAVANTAGVFKAFNSDGDFTGNVSADSNKFKMTDSTEGVSEIVTDTKRRVECYRSGNGTTIGSVDCRVFDFEVEVKKSYSSARDKQHRGVGKAVPKSGSKGSIL